MFIYCFFYKFNLNEIYFRLQVNVVTHGIIIFFNAGVYVELQFDLSTNLIRSFSAHGAFDVDPRESVHSTQTTATRCRFRSSTGGYFGASTEGSFRGSEGNSGGSLQYFAIELLDEAVGRSGYCGVMWGYVGLCVRR